MDLGGLEKLIASTGVAIAAMMAPFGVIYTAMVNSRNKTAEATIESLTADVEKLEARLAKAEEDCSKEKKSGMHWYERVFFWFNMAHEMRRLVLDTRQIAESLARMGNQPQPIWNNSLSMPDKVDNPPSP